MRYSDIYCGMCWASINTWMVAYQLKAEISTLKESILPGFILDEFGNVVQTNDAFDMLLAASEIVNDGLFNPEDNQFRTEVMAAMSGSTICYPKNVLSKSGARLPVLQTLRPHSKDTVEGFWEVLASPGTAGMSDCEREMLICLLTAVRHTPEQFYLNYQPQYDLHTDALAGVEALARWRCPINGEVSPAVFIPIAEQNDLISELGSLIMRRAFQDLAAWRRQGEGPPKLSINVTAPQLFDGSIVMLLSNLIDEFQIPAGIVTIEVTESLAMKDPIAVQKTLVAIRSLGIGVAIDDFGTGYSALSYLNMIPANDVKLDKSFVDCLIDGVGDHTLLKSVIRMGKENGFKIVAEGIESKGQHDLLKSLGCDIYQGYYGSRPVCAEEAIYFWESHEKL